MYQVANPLECNVAILFFSCGKERESWELHLGSMKHNRAIPRKIFPRSIPDLNSSKSSARTFWVSSISATITLLLTTPVNFNQPSKASFCWWTHHTIAKCLVLYGI